MEDGINPDRQKQSQSFRWFHEIDQILVVGMKYGPRGTQEAVKRVRQLTPELVPAQVWHRMRHLREKERGNSATPVDWSESAIEILREGYRSGGRKKTEAIKTVRALYPGLAGYVVSRFARSQGWLGGERADKRKRDRRPWTREEEQELFARVGYAVTSHSSQGLTAERVLIHADTSVHPDLLNSRFGYVSISRASHEATLFTDDMAKLGPQLGEDVSKTSALEINQGSSVGLGIGRAL
jgi:UvrD-like helicase C-terminal domain